MFGVAVIGVFALIANRRARLSRKQSVLAAASFALGGLDVVLLKQYLH